MYFVSVLCVANLALWLQETNKTYLLTYLHIAFSAIPEYTPANSS